MSFWKSKQLHGFGIFLAGLLILCNCGFCQELKVEFEETLAIGNQRNAEKEYLFGGPTHIATDSENNIYIADVNNTIRVFSPKGEYIRTIGNRGRGPGEFRGINALTIGNENELIVYDAHSVRVTVFYEMGDSLQTFSVSQRNDIQSNIIPLSDNRFAVTSLDNHYFQSEDEIRNTVIHLLDNAFKPTNQSFFNVYEHLFSRDIPLERRLAIQWDYNLTRVNDSLLALTHEVHDGTIHIINHESSTISGITTPFSDNDSYELLDWENRTKHSKTRYGMVRASGPEGQFAYQRKLKSAAILSNENWVLNFVQTAEGTESTYSIEFLDKQGDYIGHTSIVDDFNIREGMRLRFYPMHLDDNNQLYYADYSSGVPVIRIARIIMEE